MQEATENAGIPGRTSASRALLGTGVILLVAGGAAVAADLASQRSGDPAPVPVASSAPAPPSTDGAGAELVPTLQTAVDHYLDRPIELAFDGRKLPGTWRKLGFHRDEAGIRALAARAGRDKVIVDDGMFTVGGVTPVPVSLDRAHALELIVDLRDQYARPANDARVDLVNRKVIPETRGYAIDPYATLAFLDQAARGGQARGELAGAETIPAVTVEKLGNLDIGHVVGWFETHYPPGERDRNYNLRLVAEHVNGHILMPGETFSFNKVVGDRTEKQGYRVAHVIQAGEMIDGLAGGACQISTTLHGAAWFAGLDIVKSQPHSRPSAYVTMGLDATVVYPTTDLVLKNPYDFPVVIHYVVAQGTVRVEILGKQRPWDKITFEREILKEKPFEHVTRDDDTMPLGTQMVEQVGFPGYQLIRRRFFFKDGKEAKAEKWDISYPPTTEYVRVGTNPDPNATPPSGKEPHGLPDPGGKTYHLEQ
jgi:vancomycin resistance protein YoaR